MRFNIGRVLDLVPLIKLLEVGLRNLTFQDNFNSKTVEVTIKAGESKIVPHGLKIVPTSYIIGRKSASGEIIDGDIWDSRNISIKNLGNNTITLTLIILE